MTATTQLHRFGNLEVSEISEKHMIFKNRLPEEPDVGSRAVLFLISLLWRHIDFIQAHDLACVDLVFRILNHASAVMM